METQLTKQTVSFTDQNGEGDMEIPASVSRTDNPNTPLDDGELTVVDDSHFVDLHRKFRLSESDDMPNGLSDIKQQANGSGYYNAWRINDDTFVGLPVEPLQYTLKYLTGGINFSADEFELYYPMMVDADTERSYVVAIRSDMVPREWVVQHFDDDAPEETLGTTACTVGDESISPSESQFCEKTYDEPFISCPNCGRIPPHVQDNIDRVGQTLSGVVALLALPLLDEEPVGGDFEIAPQIV